MKKVIVLVGPTASGKTSCSIELAKAFNAEIINGDSVQIYQDLDIGSAKVKDEEKEGIPHHLFDLLTPEKPFTAYDFQKLVRETIKDIDVPIIVGGTGFYIKSALYDYKFNYEEKPLTNKYNHLSEEELYAKLIKLDPKIDIDKNNKRRLIRALLLAESGTLRSEKKGKDKPLYDVLTLYLDIDRKILNDRLHKRLDLMLEAGFIDEVKMLRKKGIKLNIIGYRELDQYLDGKLTLEEAKFKIIVASRRLAKRQKTWFMNQMDAIAFDPLDSKTKIDMIEKVDEFLKEESKWKYI